FIGVVALVVGAAQVTTGTPTCYRCSDDPEDGLPYDPECSEYSYNGIIGIQLDACFIEIQDGGYLRRGNSASWHDDGDCVYGSSYTRCYCKEDLCNTESFCSLCGYPKPTPGTSTTTEVTTLTTTKPPPSTTTEVTTTTNPPPLTTDDTTLTSTTTPGILSCYECIGCPNVDSSTPVISDASYLSCTTVVLNDANVIRGGSHEHHPDGECTVDSEIVYCWCSSNLCNNIKI
ncbi:unnamed protein product, partial [Meganyctiphanes norvegica]